MIGGHAVALAGISQPAPRKPMTLRHASAIGSCGISSTELGQPARSAMTAPVSVSPVDNEPLPATQPRQQAPGRSHGLTGMPGTQLADHPSEGLWPA